MNEQEILDAAIRAVVNQTGIQLEREKLEAAVGHGHRLDAILRLNVKGRWVEILAEVKKRLNPAMILAVQHQMNLYLEKLKNPKGKWVIITTYVNNTLAKKLREMKIQFIDVAGNVYIEEPPVYVYVQGNKLPEAWQEPERAEGAFGKTGLKVIFAILCNNKLIKATYREIEEEAGVALGTIARVFRELKHQGFLIERKPNLRKLVKKEALLEKWAAAYAEKLRPKLLLGRYDTAIPDFWINPDFWGTVEPRILGAFWGGEVAAAKITHNLKPEIITLYTQKTYNHLLVAFKLMRNKHGRVEIREKFWKFTETEQHENLVHPILIYADLLATEDPRNIETAKLIFYDHVKKYLRED